MSYPGSYRASFSASAIVTMRSRFNRIVRDVAPSPSSKGKKPPSALSTSATRSGTGPCVLELATKKHPSSTSPVDSVTIARRRPFSMRNSESSCCLAGIQRAFALSADSPVPIVVECLPQLLARVHDERSTTHDWFIDGRTSEYHQLGAADRLEKQSIADPIKEREFRCANHLFAGKD